MHIRKSKLDCSYVDMTTLKNQIRIQMNQIRSKPQQFHEYHSPAQKKHFPQKSINTCVVKPRHDPLNIPNRKHFQEGSVSYTPQNVARQKKHFRQRADSVDLSFKVNKKSCDYIRRNSMQSISPLKQISLSINLGLSNNLSRKSQSSSKHQVNR